MIELHEVNEKNIWEIVKLSVHQAQQGFVATNTVSILQAYTTLKAGGIALPFGIYQGPTPVGFVMFGYSAKKEEGDPNIALPNYCIWRFMIDQAHQGKGLGREALGVALSYLRSGPVGPATHCWLSYEPENRVAKALYRSMGFAENGEICEGELVSVLKL